MVAQICSIISNYYSSINIEWYKESLLSQYHLGVERFITTEYTPLTCQVEQQQQQQQQQLLQLQLLQL